MRFLITGGYGFIGSNLGSEALRRGHELTALDNLARRGSAQNRAWLSSVGKHHSIIADTRNAADVERAVKEARPDVVFHMAGQVAMTTSIADPHLDFETNVVGGHNLLEAVRKFAPAAAVIYSSTNKVYGDLEQYSYSESRTRYIADGFDHGFDEDVPLNFQSPYGCSKGATDQYMLDYARIYGLKTIVFRHSSVFGGRQFSTFDQGWIGWFVQKALETRDQTARDKITISGTGKQVRDVLLVTDLIDCYFAAVEHADKARGQAFNIGGGPANSLSLLELFQFLEAELKIDFKYERLPVRQSDQRVFIADVRKAQRVFGWSPKTSKADGLRRMIEWVEQAGKNG